MHHLPGAVNQRRERGDRDERLDAVLTLADFRRVVVHYILWFNRSRIEGFRPQDFMLSAQIEPRPNWPSTGPVQSRATKETR
jgi:hypothetical protein